MNTNNTLSRLSEIATRIKELRTILGYSVYYMAEKTEIPQEKYREYESGTVDIPFTFIHKCALIFGVEMTELLEGSTAKLSTYTVTRKGAGQKTAKEDGIDIANLAPKFKDKLTDWDVTNESILNTAFTKYLGNEIYKDFCHCCSRPVNGRLQHTC